jgi:hypothetical protein
MLICGGTEGTLEAAPLVGTLSTDMLRCRAGSKEWLADTSDGSDMWLAPSCVRGGTLLLKIWPALASSDCVSSSCACGGLVAFAEGLGRV